MNLRHPLLLVTMLVASSTAFNVSAKAPERAVKVQEFQFDQPFKESDKPIVKKNKSLMADMQSIEKAVTKQRESVNTAVNTDFWIYEAWLDIARDRDYDNYFTSFTLEFDADTVFAENPVYAVVYVGDEDSFYPVHTTSNFWIYSDDTQDAFVVETDLVSGFVPFDYDIMIELYDAYTDDLVAVADHLNDADLSYVPLESEEYDVVVEETVVEVHQHGGALTWPILLGLSLFGIHRKRKRSKKT